MFDQSSCGDRDRNDQAGHTEDLRDGDRTAPQRLAENGLQREQAKCGAGPDQHDQGILLSQIIAELRNRGRKAIVMLVALLRPLMGLGHFAAGVVFVCAPWGLQWYSAQSAARNADNGAIEIDTGQETYAATQRPLMQIAEGRIKIGRSGAVLGLQVRDTGRGPARFVSLYPVRRVEAIDANEVLSLCPKREVRYFPIRHPGVTLQPADTAEIVSRSIAYMHRPAIRPTFIIIAMHFVSEVDRRWVCQTFAYEDPGAALVVTALGDSGPLQPLQRWFVPD